MVCKLFFPPSAQHLVQHFLKHHRNKLRDGVLSAYQRIIRVMLVCLNKWDGHAWLEVMDVV